MTSSNSRASEASPFAYLPLECRLQIIDKVGSMYATVCKDWNRLLDNNRVWKDRCVELQTPIEGKLDPGHCRKEVLSVAREILNFAKDNLKMVLPYGCPLDEAYTKYKDQVLQRMSKNPHAFEVVAGTGRIKIARWFLDQKPAISTTSVRYALRNAAEKGHEPVVQLLLGQGVSSEAVGYALGYAAFNGHEPVVVQLLLGQEVSSKAVGDALGYALENGHEAAAQLLRGRQNRK